MATTKSRGAKSAKSSSTKSSKPKNQSLAARTGRTVRDRPYASAAIATGAVTAVAAAAAGAFFFSRRDKSLAETAEDVSARVKEKISGASERIRSMSKRSPEKTQSEIAEEALTLKETGTAAGKPGDPLIEEQLRTGAIAY